MTRVPRQLVAAGKSTPDEDTLRAEAVIRSLGPEVRALRESQRITVRELAKKAKISPSYVSKIELGRGKKPTLFVLDRIARALGRDLMHFIGTAELDQELSRKLIETDLGANSIERILRLDRETKEDLLEAVSFLLGEKERLLHQNRTRSSGTEPKRAPHEKE